MNRTLKSALCLLLVTALLLAGCAGQAGEEAAGEARGRYMEHRLTMPDGLSELLDMARIDGELVVIGRYIDGDNYPLSAWRSRDGGESWESEPVQWWEKLEELYGAGEEDSAYAVELSAVSFTPEGNLYIGFTVYPNEYFDLWETDPEAAQEQPQPDGQLAYWDGGDFRFYENIPMSDPDMGAGATAIRATDGGDFLVNYYFQVRLVNSQTGEAGNPYWSDAYFGSYLTYDNVLAITEGTGVTLYDLGSGEAIEEYTGGSGSSRAIALDREERALYFCDSGGIFRASLDGNVTERLVDGELNTFGMPSMQVSGLFLEEDGSFLACAYGSDEGYMLLRYTYDPDVLTVPSTQLKVYSLEENKTVRQAIGSYQNRNPDVKVNYEVGMTGEDGVTAADALRTLSTQLLAGEGPDVLVLDGMPMDSYMQKNVLLDLDGALGDMLEAETLGNITGALRAHGGLYAVPARFTVPVVLADVDLADDVRGLSGLAGWLDTQEEARLQLTMPSFLLQEYYSLGSTAWLGRDGALDQQAFARFLEDISRIQAVGGLLNKEYANEGAVPPSLLDVYDNLGFNSMMWKDGAVSLLTAQATSLYALSSAHSAIDQREGGGVMELMVEDSGATAAIGRTVLGVNAGSGQQELAADFVRHTLSREVQVFRFDDGLPVNRAALQDNMIDPYLETGGMRSYYGMSFNTEDAELSDLMFEMEVNWPDEGWLRDFVSRLEGIERVLPLDLTVYQMVVEETEAYFGGTRSLEDTVAALAQKYELYRAEQA